MKTKITFGSNYSDYQRGVRQLRAWNNRKDRPRNRGKRDTAPSFTRKLDNGDTWEVRGSGFYARRSA